VRRGGARLRRHGAYGSIAAMPNALSRATVLDTLLRDLAPGRVEWIGVRPPGRRRPMTVVDAADALAGLGLAGDRATVKPSRRRQVTLLQAEHLELVARLLDRTDAIDPAIVRRNVVVRGLNLAALPRGRAFRVGSAILEATGPCEPCARMEEALGRGGYAAMAGHGGITASVVDAGEVRIGDAIEVRD
jgi:MOSC domain-containing protein YiiM